VYENEPLGTIGSVSLINDFRHENILVMNADLFTNIDLEDFYQDFVDQQADMSIATVPYTVDVPYAVLNLNENNVKGFREKPTYTYHSNAGIYLIKRELLKTIPVQKSYNATDFIQALIDTGKKVVRFPIIGYWIDIGKPEDFQKVQEIAKHIRS
jgi:NDP-sugar pyrophosphorylase family protein